jgi:serine protease Do
MLVLSAAGQAADVSERDAYVVKNAFREVVSTPAHSTVRVLCDGQRVALGTIVGADGLILTKASELTDKIVCHLFDGRHLEAKIIGVSEDDDLALLKVKADQLPVIAWSEADPPPVGSWLATPGLETVPLSIGVVSVAPRVVERRMPALGVVIEEGDQGPVVREVLPRSGAAKAGLKGNDVLTQLDDKKIATRNSLVQAIRGHRPGDTVRLRLLRGDKTLTVDVELLDLTELANGETFQEDIGGRLSKRRTGFPLALQHDTVLQPNQCGGPLVDLDGNVVGINIARASRVASYALPAAVVKPVLEKLKSGELVTAKAAN